jgi:hypothetical protein
MALLDAVLHALRQGKSVRRGEWEPYVRMFVVNDILMCQCGEMKPWRHALTWSEICASDWEPIRSTAAVRPRNHEATTLLSTQRVSRLDLQSSLDDAGVSQNSPVRWLLPKRRDS